MTTPVVTGDVDPGALDDLLRLCLQFSGHGAHCVPQPAPPPHPDPDPASPAPTSPGPASPASPASPAGSPGLGQLTGMSRGAIQQAIIGKVADLLSGPAGLASFLRGPAAGRPAGRAVAAAGHRVRRHDPGRDSQRGHRAGPAVPVARRL